MVICSIWAKLIRLAAFYHKSFMNLGQQIIAGIRWTGVSSLLLLLSYFLVYGVLFHLVSPTDFAEFSLAQGIAGLILNVAAPSLGYAVVAKENLTASQFSAVFWLNLLLGLLLGGLIWFFSGFLANLYKYDHLSVSLQLICLLLPIASVGASFRYLLQREAKFKDMSVVRMAAFAAFAIVSIWGAKRGYGAFALIIAFIAQTAVESIFLILAGGRLMSPIHSFHIVEWRYFIRFGFFQGMERFVDSLVSQADTFLIGKLLGMEALGIYEAAKRILMRPLNIVSDAIEAVLFPIMAKRQNEPKIIRTLFLENVKFLGLACYMPYLLMAVLSAPLAILFLGNQWQNAGQVIGLLALVLFLRIPRMPTDALLMSKGKPEWWLAWKLVLLLLTTFDIVISSKFGLSGVLIGLIFLQILLTVLNHQFLTQKIICINWGDYWRALSIVLVPAIISVLTAYLSALFFSQPLFQVLAGGLSAGFVYIVLVMYRNKADFMTILQLLKLRS